MKKNLYLILIVFTTFANAQIPDIEARDLNQKLVSLSQLQGEKVTVIDFWATWCKPCVSAIPKLNLIYEKFEGNGVQFIGINVDGPRNQSKVKPFSKSMGINYPVLLDPDHDLVDDFNVNAFPTLLIFNNRGQKVFTHEGFSPGDEQIIQQKIEELLAK